MSDLVLRHGPCGEYLLIEHDPHIPMIADYVDPEVWRIDLPKGLTLRNARRLYAAGVRPDKSLFKRPMAKSVGR